jgi:DNA-binding transcriptional ArsR family regulator
MLQVEYESVLQTYAYVFGILVRWTVCEFCGIRRLERHYCGESSLLLKGYSHRLKEAGLVHEERRGKWSLYSLDRTAAGQLLAETAAIWTAAQAMMANRRAGREHACPVSVHP